MMPIISEATSKWNQPISISIFLASASVYYFVSDFISTV
jgi:hypothetical protein